MKSKHFLVRRDRWTEHRGLPQATFNAEHEIVTAERGPLEAGAVELGVDLFGLTTNNMTYAALGESFSYWRFFPRAEEGWGSIPVWGFASVARSEHEGIAVGERFFGYFPMSTHLVVHPRRLDESGFLDGAEHRRSLSAVYNQYRRVTSDPNYRADTEPQQAILRPVFGLSFFLADFLEAESFFGADQVLVSSASSKSAYGTAFLLAQRGSRELVGMTSRANLDFVRHLGLYDRVMAYEELASLPSTRKTLYLDLAGSAELRGSVHRHFGDALVHDSAIGATHAVALGHRDLSLPGPPPVVFFTPDRVKQRTVDWTAAGLQARLAEAWNAFLVPILDPSRGWLRVVLGKGEEDVIRSFDVISRGSCPPNEGHVLSL